MRLPAATFILAATFAGAAFAQQPSSRPPADAVPLSQILASIEQREDVAFFDEVEWDSDGYWEIEFYRADGAKVELDVDPVSGQPR